MGIDGAALAWTLFVAISTAVLFGLVPAIKISGGNLQESLKDSGHGASDGKKHDGLRSALIVSEIALACVLLVGAGLLLRSFLRILDVDLGFKPAGAASISLDYNDGGNPGKRSVFWQEVLRRVESIPGVETAGITDNLPMSRNRSWGISAKGKSYRKGELEPPFVYIVSPGYLNAIGMHLLEGRDIQWNDIDKKIGVVIINETIARKLWPGQDPIGQIANVIGMDARVIGVVADVHESSVEGKPGWQMYLSGVSPQLCPEGAQLVVRTRLAPETLASSVMSTIRQINPGQPATEFRPIQLLVDHAVSPRRFFVLTAGVFLPDGADIGFVGYLRGDLVLGDPANSGDRHTHGVGGNPGTGADGSHRKDSVAGTPRNRNRDGSVLRDFQFDCVASVRNEGYRRGHFPGYDPVAVIRGAAGRLSAGASRVAD